MAHPVAPHLGFRDFNATTFTDDTSVANPFVLAAVTFPVLGRAKNALAEQTVTLGLQCPVVDRFRFQNFTVRPLQNPLRGGDSDFNEIELVNIGTNHTETP